MKSYSILRRWSTVFLLPALLIWSCTSKKAEEDEVVIDSQAIDEQLAQIDNSPTSDETQAGFTQEVNPEQALGEAPPSDQGATAVAQDLSAPATSYEVQGDAQSALNSPTPETNTTTAPSDLATDFNATGQAGVDTASNNSWAAAPFYSESERPKKKARKSKSAPKVVESVASAAPAAGTMAKAQPSRKLPADPELKSPFERGGFLLNTAYFVRPKDNLKGIAQKIYGDSARVADLKKMNPGVSNNPKPGEVIYYNSPNRPQDNSQMLTAYEDMGLPPQTYMVEADTHRKSLGKKLLGYDAAWKELVMTNPQLRDQMQVSAGTQLRYWNDIPVPTAQPIPEPPVLAQNNSNVGVDMTPPPSMDPAQLPPPPTDTTTQLPPPPPMEVAQNDLPPPPSFDQTPPPPPPADPVMPPPAPPAPAVQASIEEESGGLSDDDMMMLLGGVGILTAGAAALIMIRNRKKQKEEMAAQMMSEATHSGVVNQ